MILFVSVLSVSSAVRPSSSAPFEASKYGVRVVLPRGWPVILREEGERVFVARVPQGDPKRPGVAACELGLAPESLKEYATRAAKGKAGTLVRNALLVSPRGERLETIHEFRPASGGLWREVRVHLIAFRQLYTFILNVDDASYPAARPLFDALVGSAAFSPPDTGADLADRARNRWVQREFRFALDLPEGWSPVLAPTEVALLFANGRARGVWADNVVVLARPHRDLDLPALARVLPGALRQAEPSCEVLSCRVLDRPGKPPALETVVRVRQGSTSLTVLERRFRGDRLDYEVKYSVESGRFDALAPSLRRDLDGFAEVPGDLPVTPAHRPRAA